MDQDDLNRFGGQQVGEIAGPLVQEIAGRLELDLLADRALIARILGDFASRLFAAGYHFGTTWTTAAIQERNPDLKISIVADAAPAYSGPLGENPELLGPGFDIE